MQKRKNFIQAVIMVLSMTVCIVFPVSAQNRDLPGDIPDGILIPGPEPFSLDVRSAIYCISLLKNNRYIEKKSESEKYRIIKVDTVWSWFLDYDESFPEGYRKRYDIIVNGTPLDWDHSFIEYGGEMINMRLLFLYRNQYPPDVLEKFRD